MKFFFDIQRFTTTAAAANAEHYITVGSTNYSSYDFSIANNGTLTFTLDGESTSYPLYTADLKQGSTTITSGGAQGTMSIDSNGDVLINLTSGTLLNLDKTKFLSTDARHFTFQNSSWSGRVLTASDNFQFLVTSDFYIHRLILKSGSTTENVGNNNCGTFTVKVVSMEDVDRTFLPATHTLIMNGVAAKNSETASSVDFTVNNSVLTFGTTFGDAKLQFIGRNKTLQCCYKGVIIDANGTVTKNIAVDSWNTFTYDNVAYKVNTGEVAVTFDGTDLTSAPQIASFSGKTLTATNTSNVATTYTVNANNTITATRNGVTKTSCVVTFPLNMDSMDFDTGDIFLGELPVTNGALVIDSATVTQIGSSAYKMVDASDSSINYGTIALDNSVVTLTQGNKNTDLNSISVTATNNVSLDAAFTGVPISVSASGASANFSVTSAATISTASGVVVVYNASALTLTSGTVNSPAIITAAGKIISSAGSVYVGVSGSTVTISQVAVGDSFIIGAHTYAMTNLGLRREDNLVATSLSTLGCAVWNAQ